MTSMQLRVASVILAGGYGMGCDIAQNTTPTTVPRSGPSPIPAPAPAPAPTPAPVSAAPEPANAVIHGKVSGTAERIHYSISGAPPERLFMLYVYQFDGPFGSPQVLFGEPFGPVNNGAWTLPGPACHNVEGEIRGIGGGLLAWHEFPAMGPCPPPTTTPQPAKCPVGKLSQSGYAALSLATLRADCTDYWIIHATASGWFRVRTAANAQVLAQPVNLAAGDDYAFVDAAPTLMLGQSVSEEGPYTYELCVNNAPNRCLCSVDP
jgi:hypothetical protein